MQVKTVTAGMKLEDQRPMGKKPSEPERTQTKEMKYIQKLLSQQMRTEDFSKVMHINMK